MMTRPFSLWLLPLLTAVLMLQVVMTSEAHYPSATVGVPHDRTWVTERIARWLPTEHERLWEHIGWVEGIGQALTRARELHRPVLLFSYAGCVAGRL